MGAEPVVSVVMAVRNGADLLPDAIASVHAQTTPVAEVIVVDGGSHDATAAVASALGARVVGQRGPTLADAYNTGVAESVGTHLAFLSHDDIWRPTKTRRQLDLLDADPDAAAAIGLVEHVLLDGHSAPPGFRRELLAAPRPARIMESLLAPRATFDRVGPFRPEVSPADDTDWYARLSDLGLRVGVVDEVVLTKRVRAGSTAHNNDRQRDHVLQIVRDSLVRKRSTHGLPGPVG